jgi:excisionase family DNA binding protein
MEEDYSRFTPEERLVKIAEILVRWIYRAEAKRRAEAAATLPVEPEKTYNLTQAAKKIGISKRTLQRWIDSGRFMPKHKNGSVYLINSEELRNLQIIKTGI